MKSHALLIDFETTANKEVDLKECGLHRYVSEADIWCMGYVLGDGDVKLWIPGQVLPEEIRFHIANQGEVIAHNANFEFQIWNKVGVQKYDFPILNPRVLTCTQAMAYAMNLPGSLEQAALALGLQNQKDMKGYQTMMKLAFLGPKEKHKAKKEELEILYEYCKKDVETERELFKRLIRLSPTEKDVWLTDQTINDRGVKVDVASIKLAIEVVDKEKERIDKELFEITKGEVGAATQVMRLKDWIEKETGKTLETIDKRAIVELSADTTLSHPIRRSLVLRQEAAKSSVSKLKTMLQWAGKDSRIRGGLQYHGAGQTGRWSGRGPQFHNLPRMKLEKWEVDSLFELLRRDDALDCIPLFHGPILPFISQALRAFIIAGEAKKLLYGDYNAIEARVLAWLAGEQAVLRVFESGGDIYRAAYAKSFGVDRDKVTPGERQIGKVMVLALGYQGGVGAFQTMARNYGVEIDDEKAGNLIQAWRGAHPAIRNLWYEYEEKAMQAVKYPGTETFASGTTPKLGVTFKLAGSFLFGRLPSGRVISYPYPKIKEVEYEWKGQKKKKEALTYMAVDSVTHKFEEQKAYGGLIVENVVQATARDVMAHAMVNLERNQFPVILTVHDEIVCETSLSAKEKEMEEIMCRLPDWAKGLPIAASVASGGRYLK